MSTIVTPTNHFDVLYQFTTGKSKDIVLQAKLDEQTVIVKLSQNIDSLRNEAMMTKQVSRLFNTFSHNPIVQIVASGKKAIYNGKTYAYYAMEDLSEEYEVLHDVIRRNCLLENWIDDIPRIFTHLLNVLAVLKSNLLSHCDLHTENIFVHRQTQKIKIIDLNMASRLCTKRRQLTAVILKEYFYCKNARTLFQLKNFLEQIISAKNIDSDIFMFIKILGLFYYDEGQFQALKIFPRIIYEAMEKKNKDNIDRALDAFVIIFNTIITGSNLL